MPLSERQWIGGVSTDNGCESAGQSVARVIDAWEELSQPDREKLIPCLLNSITSWRANGYELSARIRWLEESFREVGIALVDSIAEIQVQV